MNYLRLILPAAVIAAMLSGCEKSDNDPREENYSRGIYVVNEGSFGSSNGSISYVDPDNGLIINGIFEAANGGRPLGDVVQSIAVVNETTGYIVVNGSSKVEIVDLETFSTIAEPISADYPRYFVQVSNTKGYLSAGSLAGYLYVIDLNSHEKADSIVVGYGPETMVLLNGLLYVANSGGWGVDSTISIVNTETDIVNETIRVGKAPIDMTLDGDNNIWVYCKGYATYNWDPYYIISETDALLQKIDPLTKGITAQLKVGKAGDYTASTPKCATSKDGESIYYLRPDGVYRVNVTNPEIQKDPIIPGSFYGLEVNPSDGNIYVFESSFTGNGLMKIFDAEGDYLAEGAVGIAPNGAIFNLGSH